MDHDVVIKKSELLLKENWRIYTIGELHQCAFHFYSICHKLIWPEMSYGNMFEFDLFMSVESNYVGVLSAKRRIHENS